MFFFVPLINCLPVLSHCPINSNFIFCAGQYVLCHATILHDAISPSRHVHAEPLILRYSMVAKVH